MLTKIRKLFIRGAEHTPDGLNQDQREAIVDLLLLCIYADNKLEPNENQIFVRHMGSFNWNSELPINDYIQESKSRTLEFIQSKAKRNLHLRNISTRLKNKEIKYRVLKLCKLLFYSDWELADEEKLMIAAIRDAFGLK